MGPGLPTPDWHAPRRLYERGVPPTMTTALQVFPALGRQLRDLVRTLSAQHGCVLEVGPGDRPLIEPGPGRCYLDVSRYFLSRLSGARVEGDIEHAPFADGMFDLVVCADVFTHIPPERWGGVLDEMVRLAPRVLLFNPDPGALRYHAAPVESKALELLLRERGCVTQHWPVDQGNDQGGRYRFGIVLGQRPEPK